jgi:uncharacterized protein
VEALSERPELVRTPPYLAIVERDGEVVGACSLMPPFPLVVSPLTPVEALPLIADDLMAGGRAEQVNEMSSPANVVEPFLLLWQARTGRAGRVHIRERLYRIDAAPHVPDVPGNFRMAGDDDVELLLDWQMAFNQEAWRGALRVERERLRPGTVARVQGRGGRVGLWVDGEPVAMAAYGAGRAPAPARIAPVYTPPSARRRGYGTAVTAALTRTAFDRGHSGCMLFTDLSNPTSNHIYMDIGYRPVTDWVHARFDAA